MLEDLNGLAVLITGASSGIGAAAARAFATAGARVGVHYHENRDGAEAVAADVRGCGTEACVLQADVADVDAVTKCVAAFVDTFGRIDVLINNAGSMLGRVPVADAAPEHFHRVMDLNATSVYAACRAAVPMMRRQGGGNIINVTSIAARTGGAGGAGIYAASKATVSTLTRALAKEEAPNNIRVNAVSPGVIVTPFHDRYSTEAQLEAARTAIPQGRLGTAEDCAGTFLYLASDSLSRYVTGQVIEVNGGQLMP